MELLIKRVLVCLTLGAVACVPDLDTDESTVAAPRVLAIIADPAEAVPSQQRPVRYSALVADGNGVRTDIALGWFHCLAQKPLAELGPVSPECLQNGSEKLQPIGVGPSVEGTLPAAACSLFGPNPPQPMMGEPPGRPVDADESGGYKIPLIVGLNSEAGSKVVLYEQRITCGLASVPPQVTLEFTQRYHPNQNPSARELRVNRATGSEVIAPEQTLEVAANERVELELAWADCPTSDQCGDGVCGPDETTVSCAADCTSGGGCGGQERYLDYDRQRLALTTRREALRIAWYTTAGRYDDERTGSAEDALPTSSRNGWQAPAQPGKATLWAVLRDSRGGVGARQINVTVR
jgi:hypothetical protein